MLVEVGRATPGRGRVRVQTGLGAPVAVGRIETRIFELRFNGPIKVCWAGTNPSSGAGALKRHSSGAFTAL